MEKKWCIITILSLCYCSLDAQIKRQYTDKKDATRTVVIKEETADDFSILEKQFGNATMGQGIRITTTDVDKLNKKPTEPKPESTAEAAPPPPKESTAESGPPPKPAINSTERPKSTSSQVKARPKPPKRKPPPRVEREMPVMRGKVRRPPGPSGPPPPKTYAKVKRWKPVKRKRVKKRKKYNCFSF